MQEYIDILNRFTNLTAGAFLAGISRQRLKVHIEKGELQVYRSKIGNFLLVDDVIEFRKRREAEDKDKKLTKFRSMGGPTQKQIEGHEI